MNHFRLKLFIIVAFVCAMPFTLTHAQQEAKSALRFDHEVRTDFFAGYTGNREALERGMAKCEAKLKTEPDNPDALVWHGGGLMFQASQLFAQQDFKNGIAQYERGQAEMDKAVSLQPHSISILVARAAMLVSYSRYVPNADEQRAMLGKVISDYEEVYRQQQPIFAQLSSHSRGELLMGLAEAYLRSGSTEYCAKAHLLLKQAQAESDYAQEAAAWLQAPADAPAKTFAHKCIGCHS